LVGVAHLLIRESDIGAAAFPDIPLTVINEALLEDLRLLEQIILET
jgi:hypothetical protein